MLPCTCVQKALYEVLKRFVQEAIGLVSNTGTIPSNGSVDKGPTPTMDANVIVTPFAGSFIIELPIYLKRQ